MVASIFLKTKFSITVLVAICLFCSYTGNAQNPEQGLSNPFFCFNNNIFSECNRAYRLNQYGNIHVPPEATNDFCNGPCLSETEQLLNCIDRVASNFIFNNRATSKAIRDTLHSGCSYTTQRGSFNVKEYIRQGYSNGVVLSMSTHFTVAIAGCCLWLLHHM